MRNMFIDIKSDNKFYEEIYQELVKIGLFKEGTNLIDIEIEPNRK